jgi:hypothetical protein
MIYLAVRLSQNSATVRNLFSKPGTFDQFWLDPSSDHDEESQIRLLDDELDHGSVKWYRSPRVSYVLRTPSSN